MNTEHDDADYKLLNQRKEEGEESLEEGIAQAEIRRLILKMDGNDPRQEKLLDFRKLGGRIHTEGQQVVTQRLGARRQRYTSVFDEDGEEGRIPPPAKKLAG